MYYGGSTDGNFVDTSYGNAPQPNQLFTPGLAATTGVGQFQNQQMQPPYYGQQAPHEAEYINQQGFGQNVPAQPPQMAAMTDQFGQMNMGSKPLQLFTANLLNAAPDPRELYRPPPEIRLPPNSCISNSPFANAARASFIESNSNVVSSTGGVSVTRGFIAWRVSRVSNGGDWAREVSRAMGAMVGREFDKERRNEVAFRNI